MAGAKLGLAARLEREQGPARLAAQTGATRLGTASTHVQLARGRCSARGFTRLGFRVRGTRHGPGFGSRSGASAGSGPHATRRWLPDPGGLATPRLRSATAADGRFGCAASDRSGATCHNRNFATRLCGTCLAQSASQPFENRNPRSNSRYDVASLPVLGKMFL